MADYSQIRSLFLRYMEGNLTAEERTQLSEAAETYSTKEWEEILEPLAQATTPDQQFNILDWEKEIQFILGHNGHEEHKAGTKNTKVIPLYRRTAFKWIAAACIILMIVGGWWMAERQGARGEKEAVAQTHDVPAPTNTRAVITLADGSKVYLDSASNGTIAQENNVAVVKNSNGEIVYSSEKQVASSELVYNTLTNPRGSKVISLTLSDGTKVWLNSESSLKYPTAFTSNTREVEITGEAYFEVKHNSKQPFEVHLPNGSAVEDIGTSFNVNAYTDEADIKTTLIEGSVRIANSDQRTAILKPGEQAIINQVNSKVSRIKVQTNVDTDEVTAWKNGKFAFGESTGLKTIMRQLSRWYDVEVIYQDRIKQNFGGGMSRQSNISEVLEKLELTGKVHFKVEGKKVFVLK